MNVRFGTTFVLSGLKRHLPANIALEKVFQQVQDDNRASFGDTYSPRLSLVTAPLTKNAALILKTPDTDEPDQHHKDLTEVLDVLAYLSGRICQDN